MSPKATPEVGHEGTELAGRDLSFEPDEVEEFDIQAEAEEARESAAETESTPTSRRSEQGVGKKPAINLDDIEEFRKWKSEMDQKVQQVERQRAELERQLQQQQIQQQAAYAQSLEAQLGQTFEPDQQRALIEQIASVRARTELDAWAQWEGYVNEQAKAAGLDPAEFKPRSYQGETGRYQFEKDLAERSRAKLAAENAELRKKAESIDEQVKRMVAEALAQQGLDVVDTGAPNGGARSGSGEDWRRDSKAVQLGRMTPAQYLKKWGERSPA